MAEGEIRIGELLSGERLPSVRSMAEYLPVPFGCRGRGAGFRVGGGGRGRGASFRMWVEGAGVWTASGRG